MKKIIRVELGSRSYSIRIEGGILQNAGHAIRSVTKATQLIILTSSTVYEKYGRDFHKGLGGKNPKTFFHVIPDGEAQKNERTLLEILRKMKSLGFQRDSCLIALGGGVIGDLGGLAASIYMRGIDFVQCPTTLLAQVDASIGGKTAIDFQGIKNLIGTFYQPKIVLIDPWVLKSLNQRQLRTGLAEAIKCGVICDPQLFGTIEKQLPAILKYDFKNLFFIIWRSCLIKAKIVSEDERENGKRAWLNYGHTLGHALESYYDYASLTHGESIAYGMWAASLISNSLGLCTKETVQRQYDLLKRAGLFKKVPLFSNEKLYEKMLLDKKARSGRVQFILTRKIGLVTIQKNVPKNAIFTALGRLRAEITHRSKLSTNEGYSYV